MSVQLSNIQMEFPGTRALDGVDATFGFDEVLGLVGENGAGKSTLVNILGGTLQPTRGTVSFDGKQVVLSSPRNALELGIAHVSQEGSLVPALTGAENIMLGAEPRHFAGIVRGAKLRADAKALLSQWFPALAIDLDRPVMDLPMADRKVIEIVRALRGEIRLLILDEPTATLEAREKKQLWDIIRQLPKKGVGVVLISHFLSEVVALSDRVTILRDGAHVGTLDRSEASEARLTELMLRRDREAVRQETRSPVAKSSGQLAPVLEIKAWRTGAVEVNDFMLRQGEVVGLIGLTGAGHFGFARSLYTHQGVTNGSMAVCGAPIEARGVRAMQQAGIALVPDHRMENALAGDGTVVENLAMAHAGFAAAGGILKLGAERREAARVIDLLQVKTPNQRQLIRNLSGGNKQKISIGKWLYGAGSKYRVLIFIEPTEGVDVGAKAEIYAHMHRLADEGAGVIIASSDLGEIAQVCHRAIPFVHGRPGDEIEAPDFSESRFITAITGDTE